jgi:hypothetical protein
MSEEEWLEKKKQIKYLKERLRRAHKMKESDVVALKEKELQQALDNAEKPGTTTIPSAQKVASEDGTKPSAKDESEKQKGPSKSTTLPTFFAKTIEWTPHAYDEAPNDTPAYESSCPSGGPGGLICCEICTRKYSQFLSTTSKDIETQKTKQVNEEVMQLLGFLSGAKEQLNEAADLVRSRTGTGPMLRVMASMQKSDREKKQAKPPARKNSKPLKKSNSDGDGLPKPMPVSVSEEKSPASSNSPDLPALNSVDGEFLSQKSPRVDCWIDSQQPGVLPYQLPYEFDDSVLEKSNGYEDDEQDEAVETFAV